MASREVESIRSLVRWRSSRTAVAALLLLLAAGALSAEPTAYDSQLSATLVGTLDPGATGRLAVRWDGEPGALLDAWVDLDGNGRRTAAELVVDGMPLAGGIEVVDFDVPADAQLAAGPRLWAEVREEGWSRSPEKSGDSCGWQPGFFLPGLDDPVRAMAVFDDGSGPALYAGGKFTAAGGVLLNCVARWDGYAWSPLRGPSGTGVNGYVYVLAQFDDGSGPALYAGGHFTSAGGVTAYHIARWNGAAWSALSTGQNIYGDVLALTVFDDGSGPALYAGGSFDTYGGVTFNHVARWDGTGWHLLHGPSAAGVNDVVEALAVFDDGSGAALYAGGYFTRAGGVTADHIARWDGSAWSALSATQFGNPFFALAVFDDGSGTALYGGGWFTSAGGVQVNHVARWDGTAWSALSGPTGPGVDGDVYALAVFNDGSGPALYAGGSFTGAGGVTVNRVARWDGSSWSPLSGPSGTGVNGRVRALTVFDDGSGPALYAGGSFTIAGGEASHFIGAWRCGPDPLFSDGFETGDTSAWGSTMP